MTFMRKYLAGKSALFLEGVQEKVSNNRQFDIACSSILVSEMILISRLLKSSKTLIDSFVSRTDAIFSFIIPMKDGSTIKSTRNVVYDQIGGNGRFAGSQFIVFIISIIFNKLLLGRFAGGDLCIS